MRRRIAAATLIAPITASVAIAFPTAIGAAIVEQETAPLVQQQIIAHWNTSDGARVVEVLCKPSNAFSVTRSLIYSDHWNCLETDVYSRVFWVSAHVNNASSGGIESVTATGCSAHYSVHRCPKGLRNPYA